MSTAASATYWIGYLLLFVSTVVIAFRRRDRDRLDVSFFLTLFLVAPLLRVSGDSVAARAIVALRAVSIFLLPYALLRLSSHFRDVRRVWRVVTMSAAVAAGAIALGSPGRDLRKFSLEAAWFYLGAALIAIVATFVADTHVTSGVKARRLLFAAIGTGIFAAVSLSSGIAIAPGAHSPELARILQIGQGIALFLYALAFSTPRFLLGRWRRLERADYLSHASELEPEERGRRAGDDLFQAAVRGVGGASTFVALRQGAESNEFVVRAATTPSLVGKMLGPGAGLVGRVLGAGRPLAGPPADCEPDFAPHLTPQAVQVLVAPVTSARCWGFIVVALRRGTLFPEDDLNMLAQLGRDAATALDHAQLIADRQALVRQAADRRLREIETRVGLMIDSIKDFAMLVLDADGRVAGWHVGAQQLFGYSPADIDDESAARLFEMEAGEFAAWLADARLHGVAEREGTCQRRDGSAFIGATVIRPLANEWNEPPGFVIVTRDVTDRRGLEERVRQGQKMEAIGLLAGGVAHDFNNLLTAILGYADWLDRDLQGDPRHAQVSGIQHAAERASSLTRQLLAFSRREMLQPSTIDLSSLIGELLPMLSRIIGDRVNVVDETSASGSTVLGDASQVEQIVMNLVVNARDAMPDGGRVVVRTSDVWLEEFSKTGLAAGPYVLLEVSDSGTGMDRTTRERVFEPFFTTKDVGRGTGLGLSTVYGIVRQMGGAIDLESEVHRGTTFRLYFPETSPAALSPRLVPAVARKADETLLLVEDDDAVRAYLSQVLEGHGYRVLAAGHPQAAQSILESFRHRIHLVISDVVMPETTGPELVPLLGRARPGPAALYISGYSDMRFEGGGDLVKPHELLREPFSSTELLSRIRQILSAA